MPALTAAATENPMLAAALRYAQRGWSVIPIQPRGKRTLLEEWKPHQTRRATEEEIRGWWQRWPSANVGIVTGAISDLVVLDIDGDPGKEWAKSVPEIVSIETPVVQTGKGFHFYLKHSGGKIPNFVGKLPGVDLRGDGGLVVVPPSVHESGR